jgi:chitin disaccharide deacetylase
MTRQLIVNADDFGLSRSVNRGIIEACERGIVTSASLMVRQPGAAEAAAYARQTRAMSVGLQLDLGEWVFQDGDWVQLYEVTRADDAQAVRNEVRWQLEEFCRLTGRNPSHLDSHQHVHHNEPVRSIMVAVALELGIVLRECMPSVRYCGDFYGQDGEGLPFPEAITVEGLKEILASLSEGVTELGCHPGYFDDLKSMYRQERLEEVRVLCDPTVRQELTRLQITLRSFD